LNRKHWRAKDRSESKAVVSPDNLLTTALEKSRHSASMRAGQLHHVLYQPHSNFLARSGEASISAGMIVKTGYSGFLWFVFSREKYFFVMIDVSQVIQVTQMVILKKISQQLK
jgi:hypothetical protein